MTQISIQCPECQSVVRVPKVAHGELARCAGCKNLFRVPIDACALDEMFDQWIEEDLNDDGVTELQSPSEPISNERSRVKTPHTRPPSGLKQDKRRVAKVPSEPDMLAPSGPVPRLRSSDSPKIRFRCPSCAQKIKVHADNAGRTRRCPRCDQMIKVPSDNITTQKLAIAIKPDDAQAYLNLGLEYSTIGRTAHAMAACKRAAELDFDGEIGKRARNAMDLLREYRVR